MASVNTSNGVHILAGSLIVGHIPHYVPNAPANAELIVRVVNAHDALVEALQEFMQMWGSADAHSDSKRAQTKRAAMWDKAHEALKLAGVEDGAGAPRKG